MILSFGFWAHQLSRPERLGCVFWAPNNSESCMSQLAALHCSQASLKVVLSKPQIPGCVKIWEISWWGPLRCCITWGYKCFWNTAKWPPLCDVDMNTEDRGTICQFGTPSCRKCENSSKVSKRKSSTTTNKCNGNSTSDSSKHQELLGLLIHRPCPLSHVNNLKRHGSPSYAGLGPPNDVFFDKGLDGWYRG